LIVPDIFPDNILYGGLLIYRKPDRISVVFLTGPTTSAYLTSHPLTIPKMALCTNSGFFAGKKPPRCRVSEMIKPNKLGGQCPSQLQGISSDFHHPTYRLPFS